MYRVRSKKYETGHADTMDASEIQPLTRNNVGRLLMTRAGAEPTSHAQGKRRAPRWPFPGTVEFWLPDGRGGERHEFATSLNLSLDGMGVSFEEPLNDGQELAVAIHEPEASFHGRAVVRHCTKSGDGLYYLGMQFVYED